jgi:hypothetical protein
MFFQGMDGVTWEARGDDLTIGLSGVMSPVWWL